MLAAEFGESEEEHPDVEVAAEEPSAKKQKTSCACKRMTWC